MEEYTINYTFTGKGYFTIKAKSREHAEQLFLQHEVDDFVEEREYEFEGSDNE